MSCRAERRQAGCVRSDAIVFCLSERGCWIVVENVLYHGDAEGGTLWLCRAPVGVVLVSEGSVLLVWRVWGARLVLGRCGNAGCEEVGGIGRTWAVRGFGFVFAGAEGYICLGS